MPDTPQELRYHPEHTWARREDGRITVGITNYAQDELDTVVFVDLPEPQTRVAYGQAFGEIESTKTVNDLVAPITGTVVERNDALRDDPELVNRDPYGAGWMILVEMDDPGQLDDLLSAEEYNRQSEREQV